MKNLAENNSEKPVKLQNFIFSYFWLKSTAYCYSLVAFCKLQLIFTCWKNSIFSWPKFSKICQITSTNHHLMILFYKFFLLKSWIFWYKTSSWTLYNIFNGRKLKKKLQNFHIFYKNVGILRHCGDFEWEYFENPNHENFEIKLHIRLAVRN